MGAAAIVRSVKGITYVEIQRNNTAQLAQGSLQYRSRLRPRFVRRCVNAV
jgi:hypothetical protein